MEKITVRTTVSAPIARVWDSFVMPAHIIKWNKASPDWHTPHAENDARTGGAFSYRMEARDGSVGFDFDGTYDEVIPYQLISYVMGAERTVRVTFEETDAGVMVTETFDPESENPVEMQQAGWQAILDNFKSYTESLPTE